MFNIFNCNLLRNIIFLANVFVVFFTEYIYFLFFKDYMCCINRLTTRLASLNILYVKIFQAFALNNCLIDEKTNQELVKFTDNSPWTSRDIDYIILFNIIGENNLITKNGFEIPINSGMISLVFKAYDENDTPVIIKLKRNNIEDKLNEAIDNLLFFIRILSFIPFVHKYKFSELINKNIEIIRHQTNFLEEVDNMTRIKENCRLLEYIKIPQAKREVTEKYPNCILMEFIEGIKINEIRKDDFENFAKQVMKFGFITSIVHGFTHGDLHSGNILFIKDNDKKYPYKIGVIDFGIVYEIDENFKSELFCILTELFYEEPRNTSIKLLNSGLIEPPNIFDQIPKKDYENIINILTEIVEDCIDTSKKSNQIQIYKFILKFKEYLSNSEISDMGITLSNNFIKLQLVFAMAHGITFTLCNNQFFGLADKVINELFHTHFLFENK